MISANHARELGHHYYKTKCETSGEDAENSLDQIQSYRLSTPIYFNMCNIWKAMRDS